jgi:hypothetical protein
MRRKPLTLALLAGSLAYSLAGCSDGGPAADGPLNGPFGTPGGHFVCAVARVGHPFAFGLDTFTNHGHATIVLNRVALLHPRHERLIGSYAVPGVYILGAQPWPPVRGLPPTWKDRQAVHGFRLAPRKTFNMVLSVVATASGRTISQGMRIHYHDTAGASYLAFDHNKTIIVTAEQDRCN